MAGKVVCLEFEFISKLDSYFSMTVFTKFTLENFCSDDLARHLVLDWNLFACSRRAPSEPLLPSGDCLQSTLTINTSTLTSAVHQLVTRLRHRSSLILLFSPAKLSSKSLWDKNWKTVPKKFLSDLSKMSFSSKLCSTIEDQHKPLHRANYESFEIKRIP